MLSKSDIDLIVSSAEGTGWSLDVFTDHTKRVGIEYTYKNMLGTEFMVELRTWNGEDRVFDIEDYAAAFSKAYMDKDLGQDAADGILIIRERLNHGILVDKLTDIVCG